MVIGECPRYLKNKIELVGNEGGLETILRGRLRINRCKTREEQKMLLYVGFNMYNNLPNEVKTELRLQNFGRPLVKYIRSNKGELVK